MKWNSARAGLGLLLTAIAVLPAESAAAGDDAIRWTSDLRSAAVESERANKPMLVKFTASWCNPCQRMSKVTFQDPGVARHVNGCFIPVTVDVDRNPNLVKAAGVTLYPTTVIISPKLEVIKRIAGYKTPAQLRKELGGVCRHVDHEVAADAPKKSERKTAAVTVKPAPAPPRIAARTPAAPKVAVRSRTSIPPARSKPIQPTQTEIAAAKRQPVAEPKPAAKFEPAVVKKPAVEPKPAVEAKPAVQRTPEVNPRSKTEIKSAPVSQPVVALPKVTEPLAFDGRCLVSMLDDRKVRHGDSRYSLIFRGRVVKFHSAENKAKFKSNPEKYWPAFGGVCPVSAVDSGKPRVGNPRFSVIYQKRLWMFAGDQQRARFAKSPTAYTGLAD